MPFIRNVLFTLLILMDKKLDFLYGYSVWYVFSIRTAFIFKCLPFISPRPSPKVKLTNHNQYNVVISLTNITKQK